MNENSCRYNCKICNKNYSSASSLWNHNKKFHNSNITNNNESSKKKHEFITNNNESSILKEYFCKFCNKQFNFYQNKWDHEKNYCKKKKDIIILEKENIKLKDEIEKLKNNKISNKIVNKNNTTNNINNGTINNNTFIINKIGEESISKLKFNDIKNIFREQKNCLYHAIKYVNFNEKIPENHSFYNSSLEGKYVNVFNNDNNEIEKKNKKDFFDTILLSSINITNLLYEKFKDDLSKKKQLKLLNIIKEIENIAHLDNNKKIYITNFNEISYNNKKIIKKTWNKKINDLQISEHSSSDEEYDSDSSKDSFYYVTDSD